MAAPLDGDLPGHAGDPDRREGYEVYAVTRHRVASAVRGTRWVSAA